MLMEDHKNIFYAFQWEQITSNKVLHNSNNNCFKRWNSNNDDNSNTIIIMIIIIIVMMMMKGRGNHSRTIGKQRISRFRCCLQLVSITNGSEVISCFVKNVQAYNRRYARQSTKRFGNMTFNKTNIYCRLGGWNFECNRTQHIPCRIGTSTARA